MEVPAESVTWTVNTPDPEDFGVPLTAPAVVSDNPSGSDPEASEKVYGGSPPVAVTVPL